MIALIAAMPPANAGMKDEKADALERQNESGGKAERKANGKFRFPLSFMREILAFLQKMLYNMECKSMRKGESV